MKSHQVILWRIFTIWTHCAVCRENWVLFRFRLQLIFAVFSSCWRPPEHKIGLVTNCSILQTFHICKRSLWKKTLMWPKLPRSFLPESRICILYAKPATISSPVNTVCFFGVWKNGLIWFFC